MKNLQTKEMPSCFFNLIDGAKDRDGDTIECFAKLVLAKQDQQGK